MKKLFNVFGLFEAAYLIVIPLSLGTQLAHAAPTLLSLKFPQTQENVGAPRTTSGGGVRSGGGQCLNVSSGALPLQGLIPNGLVKLQTTSQTPTLFFYFPENKGYVGEIALENILGEKIYKNQVKLTPQAGIISATLIPNTVLEANEVYDWSLRIICDPGEPSQDIFLKGSFEFIDRPTSLPQIPQSLSAHSLVAPMTTATPETATMALAIAEKYAEQGLWLDSLNLMSFVYPSQPQEWDEFLASVGFNDLQGVPLHDPAHSCCQGEASH
jgi:hypothetical protein